MKTIKRIIKIIYQETLREFQDKFILLLGITLMLFGTANALAGSSHETREIKQTKKIRRGSLIHSFQVPFEGFNPELGTLASADLLVRSSARVGAIQYGSECTATLMLRASVAFPSIHSHQQLPEIDIVEEIDGGSHDFGIQKTSQTSSYVITDPASLHQFTQTSGQDRFPALFNGITGIISNCGQGSTVYEVEQQSRLTLTYRYVPAPISTCNGDLSGDFLINGTDRDLLFAAWGSCENQESGCTGDIDNDQDVDFNDLLLLLANWGPCR